MYLMPSASGAINNRKFNLGMLGRLAMQPVRLRGLRGMGDSMTDPTGDQAISIPIATDWTQTTFQEVGPNQYTGGSGYVTGNVPSVAAVQNPNPVAGGATNATLTTPPAGQPSQDPLDYVSPQAAIAAGLDSQVVYNTWSGRISSYPSPQAAVAAGIPAGVVNQLWQAVPKPAVAAPASIFGIPLTTVALGGGALLLLSMLGGRRRR